MSELLSETEKIAKMKEKGQVIYSTDERKRYARWRSFAEDSLFDDLPRQDSRLQQKVLTTDKPQLETVKNLQQDQIVNPKLTVIVASELHDPLVLQLTNLIQSSIRCHIINDY